MKVLDHNQDVLEEKNYMVHYVCSLKLRVENYLLLLMIMNLSVKNMMMKLNLKILLLLKNLKGKLLDVLIQGILFLNMNKLIVQIIVV